MGILTIYRLVFKGGDSKFFSPYVFERPSKKEIDKYISKNEITDTFLCIEANIVNERIE